MFVYRPRLRTTLASLAAMAVLLVGSASAETTANIPAKTANLTTIHIKNFGRMNDQYYRGAQPEKSDYPDLARLGVRTVIDLTRDGRSDERGLVERAGMKFYRIPLTTSERPSDAAVAQFLKLVNEPSNWPVYVHCQGGRHRTGVMTAVYRMNHDGWNAERAYQEMKQYRFEGFPGHPELKSFVYNYFSKLGPIRNADAGVPAEATLSN